MSKENSSISKDVAFGFLPASKSDRIFNLRDLILVQVVIGLSSFGLLTGGYTGTMLDAKQSLAAILFGNAFPMLLIVPITLYFARYGIDTFVGFRSSLGYLGSNIFFFVFLILTLGYISIALFMSGQALAEAANWMGMPDIFSSQATGAPFFSILLFICAFLVTVRGPIAIQKYTAVAVPVFMVLMFGLLAIVLFGQGFTNVAHILPSEPFESTSRSFATALELNIGLGFSWLPYLGQYSRLSKTEGGAFKAGFYSYGIIVCIAALVGALAALVAGSLNPSDWMFSIAGSWGGFIGLILLSVGNVGAGIFLMYSQAVSFKTVFPKKSWMIAMGTTVPTIFLLLSSTFYDAFGSFIAVISFIMAVLGGIVVADYFFVKRQRISIRDLYDTQGSYTYWKGINPSAVLTVVIGTIVYWALYNPLTFEASDFFLYTAAGIPTYFVALVTYYVSSKYIFRFEVDMERTSVELKEAK
ncbi:cytosine permease [Bacillus sp. AFS017274]|uniref:purine-cytosine permease family protein n=1 Tax=Bacillaceae TaxID=186817 RepID=UPI000BF9F775|nr:cytosine permease [Bacillus sp. AFS017274]PEZ82021.1 hypothetical protein CN380_08555 [Bacillus sp. AFS017274]